MQERHNSSSATDILTELLPYNAVSNNSDFPASENAIAGLDKISTLHSMFIIFRKMRTRTIQIRRE
jgi:hypothetical protein